MASKARYLTLNLAVTAILSASPALHASYPVTNLVRQERTLVARQTGVAAQDYKASWATSQSANMVALWYTNFSATAQIRVRIYSDSAWTTNIYDSGTVNARAYTGISANAQQNSDEFRIFNNCALYFAAVTTMKSITITITDASNASGAPEFSHLFIGKYTEFAQQFTWGGMPFQPVNATVNERADDESITSDKGGNHVHYELQHDELQDADIEDLTTLLTEAGGDRLIWLTLYPGDGNALEMRNQHAGKILSTTGIDAYLYGTGRTRIVFESN